MLNLSQYFPPFALVEFQEFLPWIVRKLKLNPYKVLNQSLSRINSLTSIVFIHPDITIVQAREYFRIAKEINELAELSGNPPQHILLKKIQIPFLKFCNLLLNESSQGPMHILINKMDPQTFLINLCQPDTVWDSQSAKSLIFLPLSHKGGGVRAVDQGLQLEVHVIVSAGEGVAVGAELQDCLDHGLPGTGMVYCNLLYGLPKLGLDGLQINYLCVRMKSLEQLKQVQELSLKFQLLKQSVYPRKRRSPVRSSSLKIVAPRKIIPKLKPASTEAQQPDQQINPQQPSSSGSLRILKRTNLQFKSKRSTKNQVVPWTVQNWMPRTTARAGKKGRNREEEKEMEIVKRVICQSPAPVIQEKKYEPRDTQSLLRKNSLFLLNFIKSKQKRNSKAIQLGNIPLILQRIEKNRIPFDAIKTDRQERQKKFINNLKNWREREEKYLQKIQCNTPLLSPEPW